MTEAEQERAEIVAFVLEQMNNANKRLAECTHQLSAQNFASAAVTCQRLADAIEALAHKQATQ